MMGARAAPNIVPNTAIERGRFIHRRLIVFL